MSDIDFDAAAEQHAHAVETSRLRVIGLSLNLQSIFTITEVNNRMPGDVAMPDLPMDTAHEALDNAIVTHAALLGR